MACQAALHPCVGIVAGPDVRKTVGLEVELKLNQSSGRADDRWSTRGLAGAKGRHAFVGSGEQKLSAFFALFFPTQLATQSRPDCLRRSRPQVNGLLVHPWRNVNSRNRGAWRPGRWSESRSHVGPARADVVARRNGNPNLVSDRVYRRQHKNYITRFFLAINYQITYIFCFT